MCSHVSWVTSYHLWVVWSTDPARYQFECFSFHCSHAPDQWLFGHHLTCKHKHQERTLPSGQRVKHSRCFSRYMFDKFSQNKSVLCDKSWWSTVALALIIMHLLAISSKWIKSQNGFIIYWISQRDNNKCRCLMLPVHSWRIHLYLF